MKKIVLKLAALTLAALMLVGCTAVQPTPTTPTATEPAPTQTAPTQTEPAPTETEPAPTETEPAPTETEPEPTETEPEETEPEVTPLSIEDLVPFSDMVYTRPDLDAIEDALNDALSYAEDAEDLDTLVDKIELFYDLYDEYCTAYYLADIYYSSDLTNSSWEEEYNWCETNSSTLDSSLDALYRGLAWCPLRPELETDEYFGEGFFDDYEDESIWDDTFTAMMEQESELTTRYYALNLEAAEMDYYSDEFFNGPGADMADLLVELVALRQQIADYAGYDNYVDFAYDWYFDRDYTPEQAAEYMQLIRDELVPLYRKVYSQTFWYFLRHRAKDGEAFMYVSSLADEMGGDIRDAFEYMTEGGLYDVSYNVNKFDSSFEVFFPTYEEPFVFMNPMGSNNDLLTFTHEFGHFCNDFASSGSNVGIDVAEVFSQGLEYLSLCYAPTGHSLERMKLVDSLSTFVEQAAYADFEQRLYSIPAEELSRKKLIDLYQTIGVEYGFDTWGFDSRHFVAINHFYTSPLYVISYVVSNDAAFQMYQMELENPGSGLAAYCDSLDTQESCFLAFLEEAGLDEPFEEAHVKSVADTLSVVLDESKWNTK